MFRKFKLSYSDRKQISGCLGIEEKEKGNSGEAGREIFHRGNNKLSGLMDMFTILIVVMVTQVNACHNLSNYIIYICLLHVNYTSIMKKIDPALYYPLCCGRG